MIKLLKKYRFIILFCGLPYLFLLGLVTLPTSYGCDLPGDIRPVDNVISIDSNYSEKGSFNTTFVMTYNNLTWFQRVFTEKDFKVSMFKLSPSSQMLENKYGEIQGIISKEASVYASLISSYQEASKINPEVTIHYETLGMYIYQVSSDHIDGLNEVTVGDVIAGNNAEEVSENVRKYINGEINTLPVYRRTKTGYEPRTLKPTIYEVDGVKKLKVSLSDFCYKILDSNPSYKVKSTNIGGNSGGLLQSLSIFNSLTEKDYTFGLTIAGTGAIDKSGNVHEIGAIQQKIYTANQNKVAIFFVPESQYQDALEAYQKLKNPSFILKSVSSLSEAISFLESEEAK